MSYYAVFNVSAGIMRVTPSIVTILVASVTSLYFRNNLLMLEKSSNALQTGEVVALSIISLHELLNRICVF